MRGANRGPIRARVESEHGGCPDGGRPEASHASPALTIASSVSRGSSCRAVASFDASVGTASSRTWAATAAEAEAGAGTGRERMPRRRWRRAGHRGSRGLGRFHRLDAPDLAFTAGDGVLAHVAERTCATVRDAFLAKDFAQGNHVVVHLEEGLQSEAVEPLCKKVYTAGSGAYTESSSSASSVSSGTHPSRAHDSSHVDVHGEIRAVQRQSKMHDTVFTPNPSRLSRYPRATSVGQSCKNSSDSRPPRSWCTRRRMRWMRPASR